MKKYKYTAVDINKKKFSGTFIAENENDLAVQLSKQNLFLVKCSPYKDGTPSAFFTLGTGEVSIKELTMFCRQFSIMLNSGLTILESLECLKDQAFSSYFKSLLQIIYEDVKSGVVLSDALNKHKSVFPDFFRSMIYVGEVSGRLDAVFSALSDYYEKDSAIKRKVKSAFSYPIMLACLTVALVVMMLTFIVPKFKATLADLNVEATGITKVVYDVSDFILANWLYMLAIIVVIGVVLFIFSRTKKGKYFFDAMKLRVPLIRTVQIDTMASRFARSFALMLTSGMDVAGALDAVRIIIGNREAEDRFVKATEEVKQGSKIAAAFEKYKLFPQIMLQMIAVGERTAQLDCVMNRSCSYFDDQVETSLQSVTSVIQPALLLILGAVIGVLFIAVYSPIISIMTTI